MLRALVEFSLRFRGVVISLACVTIGYGIYSAYHAKLDVFPEFAPPQVIIQTEAPGLSPEDVEQLVTRPVETAVNGVGNLETIRSQSIQGLSVITIIFREGTDIYLARQQVNERLVEAANRLPQGVQPPVMTPLTTGTSVVLVVGLTSESRSLMELRTFAEWVARPQLLAVSGVAKVSIYGGDVRQVQIQVEPEKLLVHDLSLTEVLDVARRATGVRGAGLIDTKTQRIVVQSEGQALTAEQVGEAVIAERNGTLLKLKDVAHVVDAAEIKFGDAQIMGTSGIIMVISTQFGANTLQVTTDLERAIDSLKPAVDAERISFHPRLFRPASFIETAIGNVNQAMLIGGILVSAVLFLFLMNVRTAFISLTAIPLSLLIAVIVLNWFGFTLNTLTLGGLAISIGEVVDDAIIDVENIYRRLREAPASEKSESVLRIVLNASLEVRSAVVYATFVVALVFLPVMTMSGLQGKLFAPLGLAYILAILASLLVALTVTPALSLALLPRQLAQAHEPKLLATLKRRYVQLLDAATRRRRGIILVTGLLCLAAVAALPFFGGTFVPELREGHFIVHMSAVPGTSLEESLRIGRQVTAELLKNPHIVSVAQQVGRAEKSDDVWGTHYSEIQVDLAPLHGEEGEFVMGEIREALTQFPGLNFAIKPFLTERIEETISGFTASVVVKLFGDDLDSLDGAAHDVARVLSGIRGAADVQVESPPGAPRLVIRLRPDRLQQFNLLPVDVLEAVQTAFQGTAVGQIYEGHRVYDVVVILDPARRAEPEGSGSLLVRTPSGKHVPLEELADVYQTSGRYAIVHDATRRRQAVSCNVGGRDVASFVGEAKQAVLSQVSFPRGVLPVFTGAAEARAEAQREILLHSTIAGLGIVLLLAIVFGTARNLALVLLNLPFALVGGVLAVFLTGGWLTVGSLVGFVTLFGISTRNSIMLISHFEHLVTQEGMEWGPATAFRGASERLIPILMTALVTGLGLLPIAIGSGDPGREVEGPMAIVILGGLSTSTLLNLIVLPVLALRFARLSRIENDK
jgi:CzcA family heavy metal efflux pump